MFLLLCVFIAVLDQKYAIENNPTNMAKGTQLLMFAGGYDCVFFWTPPSITSTGPGVDGKAQVP